MSDLVTVSIAMKVAVGINLLTVFLNWFLMNQATELHRLIRKDMEDYLKK